LQALFERLGSHAADAGNFEGTPQSRFEFVESAIAYRLAIPDSQARADALAHSGHGYLVYAPLALAPISGRAGLIASMPITTALAALLATRLSDKALTEQHPHAHDGATPIEPTSAAITSSATASEFTASVSEEPPIEKMRSTGREAPA
jgi:hypothetical protein